MAIKNKVNELTARQHEFLALLEEMPYSQVDTYINNHVTSLATARAFLKKLTKIVLYLIKESS